MVELLGEGDAEPGHDQADVKTMVAALAEQYYGQGRGDEDVIIEELANDTNGLVQPFTEIARVDNQAFRLDGRHTQLDLHECASV